MNKRPQRGSSGRTHRAGALSPPSARPRRTQSERREQTRQALVDAALAQMEAGTSFDALSLRSVARAAGIVPTAFYRHFESMDELGLALVDESFRTLRTMLREAREGGLPPRHMIRASVAILIDHVRAHPQHFAFIARARASGSSTLRHAIRTEIRLITSELATDLARFPVQREWTNEDLNMLAALLVNTMIAIVDGVLDVLSDASTARRSSELAELARIAEKQLRLPLLAVPYWRSSSDLRGTAAPDAANASQSDH